MPDISGVHHVAFTVTDVERSSAWYTDLLGMQVLLSSDGEDGVRSRVLVEPTSGAAVALRQYPNGSGDQFDEFRTGLDHLAFTVASREELEKWQGELDARGITFSPVAETPVGSLVVFRDPDGIQLEFWHPAV